MLMSVNNYSVNEIYSHSGSTANELAIVYIALMVTMGRHSVGGAGCQKGMQCNAFTLPPYSCDEVAPSILLAPSKEQTYLALSWWQMGATTSFSQQKAETPGSQICGLNSQYRRGQRHRVTRGYRYAEKTMSSSVVRFSLIVFNTFSTRSLMLLLLTCRITEPFGISRFL